MVNKVIREYHSDDSFKERYKYNIDSDVTEYQLCLAFATDSAGKGNFKPQWETQKITPLLVQEFKAKCATSNLRVKVFVSIGGNDTFKVVGVGKNDWIAKAKESLRTIIRMYHIDGIDVNYTNIQSNPTMFGDCIKELIEGLKHDQAQATTGFVASFAPAINNNGAYYLPLYNVIDKTLIATVVFQCFVDFEPDTDNPVKSLVDYVVNIVLKDYNDNATKVLLGYSAIQSDWNKVSLPLFFLALNRLVLSQPRVTGASLKVISDTTASFPAKWTPEYLSWAASDAGRLP